jgi:hypothetical protein
VSEPSGDGRKVTASASPSGVQTVTVTRRTAGKGGTCPSQVRSCSAIASASAGRSGQDR